jgi:hypothetical protein
MAATDDSDPIPPNELDCGGVNYHWNDSSSDAMDGIKHLFRSVDTDHMKHVTGGRLDLADYTSTMIWSSKVYLYVANGYMPPSHPWDADKVKKFGCWIKQGCPENP